MEIAFGFRVGMSSSLVPVWHVLVALCVEHVWISDFSFGVGSSSLICCSWGVLSLVCFWDYLCNKLDVPT